MRQIKSGQIFNIHGKRIEEEGEKVNESDFVYTCFFIRLKQDSYLLFLLNKEDVAIERFDEIIVNNKIKKGNKLFSLEELKSFLSSKQIEITETHLFDFIPLPFKKEEPKLFKKVDYDLKFVYHDDKDEDGDKDYSY